MIHIGKIFLVTVGLGGVFTFSTASKLSDFANSLQPREWAVLSEENDGSGFGENLLSVPSQDILQYASKAKWDPFSKRILFIGQGHYSLQKFISYSDATGKWQVEPKPSWDCSQTGGGCIGHAYEHNTLNPQTGDFYYGFYGWGRNPVKLSRATGKWTNLPTAPSGQYKVAMGFEYFPEMGGLILAGGGYVHFFNEALNSWTTLDQGLPMGSYHAFANYNSHHRAVICGGGNGGNQFYKVNDKGAVTRMTNAPINLGTGSSAQAVDPVTGKYLVFGSDESLREYDLETDTWKTISTGGKEMPFQEARQGGASMVLVPVSTYGVVVALTWDFHRSKALVYKHAQMSGVGAEKQAALPKNHNLLASPNPFRNTVRLEWPGKQYQKITFEIFSLDGKRVAGITAPKSQNTLFWNPQGLSQGTYWVKASGGGAVSLKKVIYLQ